MPRVIKPLESYKDLKEDLEEVIDKHWPDFARFNQVNDYISICWEDILRFEYFAKDENGDGRYTRLLKDRKDDWTAHSVKVRNDCKRWAQWQVSAHRDIALAKTQNYRWHATLPRETPPFGWTVAEADELNRLFKRRDLIVVKTLREMRQAYRDSKGGNEEYAVLSHDGDASSASSSRHSAPHNSRAGSRAGSPPHYSPSPSAYEPSDDAPSDTSNSLLRSVDRFAGSSRKRGIYSGLI